MGQKMTHQVSTIIIHLHSVHTKTFKDRITIFPTTVQYIMPRCKQRFGYTEVKVLARNNLCECILSHLHIYEYSTHKRTQYKCNKSTKTLRSSVDPIKTLTAMDGGVVIHILAAHGTKWPQTSWLPIMSFPGDQCLCYIDKHWVKGL